MTKQRVTNRSIYVVHHLRGAFFEGWLLFEMSSVNPSNDKGTPSLTSLVFASSPSRPNRKLLDGAFAADALGDVSRDAI